MILFFGVLIIRYSVGMNNKQMNKGSGMNRKYILAVDDTPNNLKLLGHILKDEYTLNFATDGYKALESIGKRKPDLILLDIMMPEKDGFEVCRELKSNIETEAIPIIFLTAKSDRNSVLKGLSLGACDYLVKPFDKDDVLLRISKIFNNDECFNTDSEKKCDIDLFFYEKQTVQL